jgi:hypothetical protein
MGRKTFDIDEGIPPTRTIRAANIPGFQEWLLRLYDEKDADTDEGLVPKLGYQVKARGGSRLHVKVFGTSVMGRKEGIFYSRLSGFPRKAHSDGRYRTGSSTQGSSRGATLSQPEVGSIVRGLYRPESRDTEHPKFSLPPGGL